MHILIGQGIDLRKLSGNMKIQFTGIAFPYTREEILSAGSVFKDSARKKEMISSVSQLASHMIKDSAYGYLEPKRMIQPEVAENSKHSLLSGQRM